MTVPLTRPATPDGLFLWVMHRFAEVFEDHAVVKGGLALRLLDCPRSTTDIDYVFVPFRSKKDIAERIESVLREIEGARISVDVHSKMLRARVQVDSAEIQVEASVDTDTSTIPLSTAGFASAQGQPPRIVRAMSLDVALAHKLAAWNERRLLRDLYDTYFLSARLGETPDREVLSQRLARVESRLPHLRKRSSMELHELGEELRGAAAELAEDDVRAELAAVLPEEELVGLVPRLRAAVVRIAEILEEPGSE